MRRSFRGLRNRDGGNECGRRKRIGSRGLSFLRHWSAGCGWAWIGSRAGLFSTGKIWLAILIGERRIGIVGGVVRKTIFWRRDLDL